MSLQWQLVHDEGEIDMSSSVVWTEKVFIEKSETWPTGWFWMVRYERNEDGQIRIATVRRFRGDVPKEPSP
jgi:hypothetical protein